MRSEIVTGWIARSNWSTWKRDPIAGDASARRYERLVKDNETTVILMDAPPSTCGSQSSFVDIALHLRGLGLAAPQVFEWDDALGLMVIEDLGGVDFAQHLKRSQTDELSLYENAVDVLRALQSAPPPPGLNRMTPDIGADMIDIAFEWAATDKSVELETAIKTHINDLLNQVDPNPNVLSLRDYHAENLIWRPQHSELARVGLWDFQDALVTHATYDLASLLRDARRDVTPDLLNLLLPRLVQNKGDLDQRRAAFHVIAVQRNLRILGIFNRLAQQDGKKTYLGLIPRVWAHLKTDLSTPACAMLAPLVQRAFAEMDSA
jgi:aminoglycoside/choline kinase family phosphotransferase